MINGIKDLKKPTLIIDESERQYFLGYSSSFGYLLLLDETYFFVDSRYIYSAKEELEPQGVKVELYTGLEQIKNILISKKITSLGIDYSLTSLTEYKKLKALGVKFRDVRKKLEKIFSIKNREEIGYIKKACKIAEEAFYKTLPYIKAGVTEREIANRLEYFMKELGAEKTSFDTIVAFSINSAVPHHETGETKLKDNSAILIDFGCKYKGYCSDCTRTMFFGKPDEKFLNAYNFTLQANELAISEIKSGMEFKEADCIARNVLKTDNIDKYFTHSLGHGIGVNIHEYPYISPKAESGKLKNGMVFSIEPGVYFDGEFGIRIEDTCYLNKGKVSRLFNDNKKLIIIND